ncbi:RND superfamily putative drug exporter [Microbacterium sp. SLBN-154]|uniref:MMPL family transporter n=1 Tax=Microbacterium sp. SLBN-154 TaxID=2768458 RepID=UPI001153E1D4|nr:MMPL family transporter [Microbacterium sp. SLBN-154]TQK20743.1 RND superfamily putative drug exporter [Microbacterium sp. SLBN-154]
MNGYVRFITAAKTSWIVLVLAAAAAAALFAWGTGGESDNAPAVGLPDSAESVQVDELLDEFPSADTTSAFLVFEAEGDELSAETLETINGKVFGDLVDFTPDGFVPPAQVSDDGRVALVIVPLDPETGIEAQSERAQEIRDAASADLGDDVRVYFTGPEGFEVDLAAVFAGADITLLLTTVIVVAILLLITYRSPWLWLVPLTVIGVADALAGIVARNVAAAVGVELDPSITGILSVLVFGAGTNYALLLIARYRDELRLHEDRREAMRRAVRGAGPAIIASGSTVALALATLLFAELAGNRALGLACAVGIVVAMIFALAVLPAALVLFGRGLFWPYIPRFGSRDAISRSPWGKLGRGVSRRPAIVAISGFVVLGALASGVFFVQTGLSQNDRFLDKPEAVVGQEIIADAFSAGATSPATVVVGRDDAEAAVAELETIDGVDAAAIAEETDDLARIDVTLDASAETPEAYAAITAMRAALDDVGAGDGLVGGLDARSLDVAEAQARDQALVIPLILVLVFIVLVVLLRALVAPLLLLVAVVVSFFSAVGASWWLFQTPLFNFPAIDTNVLLFSFLFLVALGVDYSIFLVTRAKEEADRLGITQGMIRALAATGAVITSAGILLAAVFAVLGVLPLITLTQIGIIVCIGVLIDTLLVRTVIVPALTFLLRDRVWWPRRPKLSDADAAAQGADAFADPLEVERRRAAAAAASGEDVGSGDPSKAPAVAGG